jgi:hypothetical protein
MLSGCSYISPPGIKARIKATMSGKVVTSPPAPE